VGNRARLEAVLGNDPRVVIASAGLAAEAGDADVWLDAAHPDMASMTGPPPHTASAQRVKCRVETGDAYLERNDIAVVDFLKLDVEGAELDVLHGFSHALQQDRIAIVQFEFTLWAAVARVWLADFYDLLAPLGFTIGKIFPTNRRVAAVCTRARGVRASQLPRRP
jgi:FkbM family methyltransferase